MHGGGLPGSNIKLLIMNMNMIFIQLLQSILSDESDSY